MELLELMDELEKLKALLDRIVKDPGFSPERDESGAIVKTKCNLAVQYVLKGYGYEKFDGLMANEICDKILTSEEWLELQSTQAQKAANFGKPVIAVHPYKEHGHVAMIAPGQLSTSGAWGVSVPYVANVGKDQGYMGANFAFPVADSPPHYYMLLC